MSSDHWTHFHCLACEKQIEGAEYCSESCRLVDFEKASSTSGSSPSSPGFDTTTFSWSTRSGSKFHLPPPYDFSAGQPYGRTPQQPRSYHASQQPQSSRRATHSLTPSSSQSSLCSLRSLQSNTLTTVPETLQLSQKDMKELQAYTMYFDLANRQRRRSC